MNIMACAVCLNICIGLHAAAVAMHGNTSLCLRQVSGMNIPTAPVTAHTTPYRVFARNAAKLLQVSSSSQCFVSESVRLILGLLHRDSYGSY